MSAYQLSPKHIDYLVSAALLWRAAGHDTGDATARMLETENWRSVSYRYQDAAEMWSAPDPDRAHRMTLNVKPIQVIKALNCYEYQSCEHPGWEGSEAHKFCRRLMSEAIRRLPGYDECDWSID